jgi:predicted nucleotidyltransferase component of viral defense system
MIPGREFDAKATGRGIFLTTIELDYAQNWLLATLNSFNMALKGGTGIKKVYFKDYRFSDDLDFTMIDEYEQDEL